VRAPEKGRRLFQIEIPDLVSQTFPQKMAFLSGSVERAVSALGGVIDN
jgi:hypothetical protein